MPVIQEILKELFGVTNFTKLDMTSALHQETNSKFLSSWKYSSFRSPQTEEPYDKSRNH